MQSIEKLRKTLNPIFMRHNAEEVFVADLNNDAVLNLYVVGCPRAKLPQIQKEIRVALHQPAGVAIMHVEAEMMIDSQIREDGELLYKKKCA